MRQPGQSAYSNTIERAAGMKGYHIGFILLLATAVWPFVAMWLSANQMLRLSTEEPVRIFALFVAVSATIHQFVTRTTRRGNVARRIFAVCLLVICFEGFSSSNRMFLFWKMKLISPGQWRQMALDMEVAGREFASRNEHGDFSAKDLPDSFRPMGRLDECMGGKTQLGPDGTYLGAVVIYGNQRQNWRLAVGADEFLNFISEIPMKRVRVATNAYFFIGRH